VHAFEANPSKIPDLRLTATHLPNTTVHGLALSDRDTRAELFVPEDETMASLRDWTEGRVGAIRRERCEMRRIDSLVNDGVLPLPDFIKCDVEGAELQVFAGGSRVLDSAAAPIILYEANGPSAGAFGLSISAATDFLRELPAPGYTFFHVQPAGEMRPIERFTPDCDYYNLLAIPRSRMTRL
jgi:FkbM family methyltransferase